MVPVGGEVCGMCNVLEESCAHLFLYCQFAMGVWYQIFWWLGFVLVISASASTLMSMMVAAGKNERKRRGLVILLASLLQRQYKI